MPLQPLRRQLFSLSLSLSLWRNLPVTLLLLFGILFSGHRARTSTPEWSEDLVTYMSGFLTAEIHQNPYDDALVRSVAADNGLQLQDSYGYIYSPAFLPLIEPLRVLSPANFRRLWQYSSLFACWLGVLLLIQRLSGRRKTLLLAVLVILLCLGGPVISTLRWGQVTGFLFLGLCIAISRNMRGVLSGIVMIPLPATKIGMALPLIALRGRRAWIGLVSALFLLVVVSLLLYYSGIWSDFFNALGSSARNWNMSIPGNRSLFSSVSRLFDLSFAGRMDMISIDRAARMAFSVQRASLIRVTGIGISIGYLAVCLGVVTRWFRQKPGIDPVFLAAWSAWISVALVPMVYDHYALFMLPLIVEIFRRGKIRSGVLLLIGFAWWTLAPMTPQVKLSNMLWVLYETLRPLIVLIFGALALKMVPVMLQRGGK